MRESVCVGLCGCVWCLRVSGLSLSLSVSLSISLSLCLSFYLSLSLSLSLSFLLSVCSLSVFATLSLEHENQGKVLNSSHELSKCSCVHLCVRLCVCLCVYLHECVFVSVCINVQGSSELKPHRILRVSLHACACACRFVIVYVFAGMCVCVCACYCMRVATLALPTWQCQSIVSRSITHSNTTNCFCSAATQVQKLVRFKNLARAWCAVCAQQRLLMHEECTFPPLQCIEQLVLCTMKL